MNNRSRKGLRQLRAIASMAVMVLVVAACSSSDDDASPATTVPPPAPTTTTATTAAPSQDDTIPVAIYHGSECIYDGPSEFDVGSTVTFTVTNDSETTGVGFGVVMFPEGTTPEEIYDEGIFNVLPSGAGPISVVSAPTTLGEEYDLTVTFDEPGQHGINCFDRSGGENDGEGLDYVTMFTVKG